MNNNEATIEQINEVIGIFMGGMYKDVNIGGRQYKRFYMPGKSGWDYCKSTLSLGYHESLDELMPVVENISEIHNNSFCVTIRTNLWCTIEAVTQQSIAYDIEFSEINEKGDNIHQSVYHACYKFIQWYNQQTKPEQSKQ